MPSTDLETRAQAGDARAQVELAAHLDGQGRHDEAINWLSLAAKAGDAQALRLLGQRLLTGQDAPSLPREGARLLADAARLGDAEASLTAAVLLGGGFFAPQDWRMALDYLQLAAQQGASAAQEQLEILASAPSSGDWAALRQSVDVAAWTASPAPSTLNATPRVLSVDGLVPEAACRWIIEQSRDKLARAEVHDPRTGLTVMGATRTNRVANFSLLQTHLLNLLVQARISAACGLPVRAMEAFAVLHYAVGEEASEHFDYLEPSVPAYAAEIAQLGQRVATALLYLNEDYDGGETAFPELSFSHRGGVGDALIFFSADEAGTPDPRSVHAGRAPTRGEKWVLSQFIRNRTIAPG
jgi:prolyl 4-hydroxylase